MEVVGSWSEPGKCCCPPTKTSLIKVNQGSMEALEWILKAVARGVDTNRNGDMRSSAGRMYAELGFGLDPSMYDDNGVPEWEKR
jgi:hypothetical protein